MPITKSFPPNLNYTPRDLKTLLANLPTMQQRGGMLRPLLQQDEFVLRNLSRKFGKEILEGLKDPATFVSDLYRDEAGKLKEREEQLSKTGNAPKKLLDALQKDKQELHQKMEQVKQGLNITKEFFEKRKKIWKDREEFVKTVFLFLLGFVPGRLSSRL
jgi:hypothetical protein